VQPRASSAASWSYCSRKARNVAFCARTADEVAEAVEALKRPDSEVLGEAVNVRDGEAYKAWLARSVAALGGCDIFIPGVSGGAAMDSEKNWVRNFEVDMLHTVRGCEALMPHLEKSGTGSIVIIGSTNAVETFAAPMAYNAIKAGPDRLRETAVAICRSKQIRVNSVSPGPIYFEGGAWEMNKGTQPKFYEWAMKQLPRADGHGRRDRARHRVRRQSGGQPHHRRQCHRR
jgi:3-oxoacyl-[acyl-carrier protein] reductase